MARHAARHRVDRIAHRDAFLFQDIGHLAQRMLRLRHRHAIARHDDHRAGILQDEGGILGAARLDQPVGGPGRRRRGAAFGAETAQDHIEDRAVHALAHDVAQDRARAADQGAGDDQRGVAQGEADAGRRPSGIGVQHRDHHRHVGAADGNDQGDAEDEGQARDRPEGPVLLVDHEIDDQADDRNKQRQVQQMPGRQQNGRAPHVAVQLGEGDHRAGEGDRPDRQAQGKLDQRLQVDRARRADAIGLRRVDRDRSRPATQKDDRHFLARTPIDVAALQRAGDVEHVREDEVGCVDRDAPVVLGDDRERREDGGGERLLDRSRLHRVRRSTERQVAAREKDARAKSLESNGPDVSHADGDYGTRFLATAGVFNLLAALHAYEIARGRKA